MDLFTIPDNLGKMIWDYLVSILGRPWYSSRFNSQSQVKQKVIEV